MLVDEITVDRDDQRCRLSARVELNRSRREFRLFYEYPLEAAEWLRPCADPFIAALLLPSMHLGDTLSVESKASGKLLSALPNIMKLFRTFDNRLQPVQISTAGTEERATTPRGSALFFSGGIDSFYSLIKLSDSPGELSHLILVNGFDVSIRDTALCSKVYAAARDVAGNFEVSLIPVSTNLRSLTDHYVNWVFAFGPALASVGLSLQGLFGRVYIASDLPNTLYPTGSRPDLDPLWSTESTTFIHHGYETLKREKGKLVATNPLAQKYLRVCWENRHGAYNCGRCMKCILTMLDLHLAGVLPKFTGFPTKLSPDLVRRTRLLLEPNSELIDYFIETETADLRKIGETELANALIHAMAMSKLRQRFVVTPWMRFRRLVRNP